MPGRMPWLRAGGLQERTCGRLPPVVMMVGPDRFRSAQPQLQREVGEAQASPEHGAVAASVAASQAT